MKELVISRDDSGQRLDKFLSKSFPLLPAGQLYKAIRLKRVKCNGKRTQAAQRLEEGDVLRLYISDDFLTVPREDTAYQTASADVRVVYEDENILLADKPAGLLVHADEHECADTLIARIQAYLFRSGSYDPQAAHSFAPALCNRIDRNTSGIVIAAKNAEALRIMNEQIRRRNLTKKYLCAVHGTLSPRKGLLENYLRKNAAENKVYVLSKRAPGSVTAKTAYRVLREKNGLSLVEAQILTGRTHQIRAQFAHIGHPLLGDCKYGLQRENQQYGYRFQALVSYRLRFDFDADAGILAPLRGREFSLPEEEIPFLSLFD